MYKASVQQSKLTGQSVERPADQTKEEFTKRRELGQRYIDQLKAMLTPEQIALLPGLGMGRPNGLATGSVLTQPAQDLKNARQEKLRQLRKGPSIQPSSGGSVKQKKREADN